MPDVVISPAAMRIVKLLVGREPRTISDLLRPAGVTRTAVAEQLGELVAAGFVEQDTQRANGRGRPRHLYRATDAALALLFPGNQQCLVPAVWRAVLELGGEEMFKKIVKRTGRLMAQHYNHRITATKPLERLRQFVALLAAEGGLTDVVENGRRSTVLLKRNCPFFSMFDEHRGVCLIDLEMLGAVVGRPVRQTACRHAGDPCCAFEIVEKDNA